jgi:hypothetical protein
MSLNRFCFVSLPTDKYFALPRCESPGVRAPSLIKSRFFQLQRHQHIASIRFGKTASQHYPGLVQI